MVTDAIGDGSECVEVAQDSQSLMDGMGKWGPRQGSRELSPLIENTDAYLSSSSLWAVF